MRFERTQERASPTYNPLETHTETFPESTDKGFLMNWVRLSAFNVCLWMSYERCKIWSDSVLGNSDVDDSAIGTELEEGGAVFE